MEFERKWYKILIFKRGITYHIKINQTELNINFDNEDSAKKYACWFVDGLDNIKEEIRFLFC